MPIYTFNQRALVPNKKPWSTYAFSEPTDIEAEALSASFSLSVPSIGMFVPEQTGFTNMTWPPSWTPTTEVDFFAYQYSSSEPMCEIELLNGATLEDIFDTTFNKDTFRLRRLGGSHNLNTNWSISRITIKNLELFQPTKLRIRWGEGEWDDTSASRFRMVFWKLYGGINNSNYELITSFFVMPWGKGHYKEYSDFIIDNAGSYNCFRFELGPVSEIATPSVEGFDLFTGWFDNEQEEQSFNYRPVTGPDVATPVENIWATSSISGYEPENAFDGDVSTKWDPGGGSGHKHLYVDLGAPTLINFIKLFMTDSVVKGFNSQSAVWNGEIGLSGSNNLAYWHNLFPYPSTFPHPRHQPDPPVGGWIDLTDVNLAAYRYYRLSLFVNDTDHYVHVGDFELGYRGMIVAASLEYGFEVDALTNTTIVSREFECDGKTGLTTIGQDDTPTQPYIDLPKFEVDNRTGLVAGEYWHEYENHVLEMEPSVQAHTAMRGDMSWWHNVTANSGNQREAQSDIEYTYEVEGKLAEVCFGNMAPGYWEVPEAEGYTGALGSAQLNWEVIGSALPGVTSWAALSGDGPKMQAFTGAIATMEYGPGVDATALVHILSRLEEYIPLGSIEATAVVGQGASGTGRYRFSAAATARHTNFSSADLSNSFYRTEGWTLTGISGKGTITYTYTIGSEATPDITSSASLTIPGRVVRASTQSSRFDNYTLQYGAPL